MEKLAISKARVVVVRDDALYDPSSCRGDIRQGENSCPVSVIEATCALAHLLNQVLGSGGVVSRDKHDISHCEGHFQARADTI